MTPPCQTMWRSYNLLPIVNGWMDESMDESYVDGWVYVLLHWTSVWIKLIQPPFHPFIYMIIQERFERTGQLTSWTDPPNMELKLRISLYWYEGTDPSDGPQWDPPCFISFSLKVKIFCVCLFPKKSTSVVWLCLHICVCVSLRQNLNLQQRGAYRGSFSPAQYANIRWIILFEPLVLQVHRAPSTFEVCMCVCMCMCVATPMLSQITPKVSHLD